MAGGIVSMAKYLSERCVCAPQYALVGTWMAPIESVSVRVALSAIEVTSFVVWSMSSSLFMISQNMMVRAAILINDIHREKIILYCFFSAI